MNIYGLFFLIFIQFFLSFMLSFDQPFLDSLFFLSFFSFPLSFPSIIYLEYINYKCLSIIYYLSIHSSWICTPFINHESIYHLSIVYLTSIIYQYVCLTAYQPACLSSFCLFLSIVTSSLIWVLWRVPPSEPDIMATWYLAPILWSLEKSLSVV